MNRLPRIVIAGAGAMGAAHADAFNSGGAEIVAVADRDHERARTLAQRMGCRACTTVGELLELAPDALSICLPHSLHFEAAMAAAERRVALLIEKPHCVTLEESAALREACRRNQVLAMAGFTHRFLRTSRCLKAAVEAGRLGKIELVVDRLIAGPLVPPAPGWYRQRAMAGGGIAMIGMIHSIDRFRWLLESEVVSVQAMVRAPGEGDDVEGTALALLEFANGTQASLVAHRSPSPGHLRSHHYELYGDRMNAYGEVGSFDDQHLRLVGEACEEHRVTDDRPFHAEIREFLAALAEGRQPQPDLEEAEKALAVVLAIYASAQTKRPILMRDFPGHVLPNANT
jgi:predicted dehydrogenase